MADESAFKRGKSLKSILSRARKIPLEPDAKPLPYRPVKQTFVQYHVTNEDLGPRSLAGPPGIAPRGSSHRNTWPTSAKDRKAGSYAFDTVPTLVRTPWENDRSCRRPTSNRAPWRAHKPLPQHVFEQLPREIYDCIVNQLEILHACGNVVDARLRQRDLRTLLCVSKRWHRVAHEHMYREIWLPDHVEVPQRTFSLQNPKTRLQLLQRTLKESGALAHIPRHLRITADLAATLDTRDPAMRTNRRTAFGTLAEIVSVCPDLEYLSGYVPLLQDKTSAILLGPLLTRSRLRSHAWNLRAGRLPDAASLYTPYDLPACHSGWQQLETLALCTTGNISLGIGVVSAIMQRLPNLKHLLISGLGRHDFHNGTLLSLPALRSLRLEHLDGITDQGVEQLAYGRLALSLESLTLVGLELTSLRVVQILLANIYRLRRFTMVQDASIGFQPGLESASMLRCLESSTLQYLHWDVLVAGCGTTLIANSIASGRFPALRKVKVPCDYDGAIQALCRPIAHKPLDANDLELIERFNTQRYERFLRVAEIQAQLRIRASRQQPSFNVVVHDENKRISATHVIGSYIGSMGSKIEYSLEPDVEGSHYALIDFSDVAAPSWLYEERNEMKRSVKGEQVLDMRMLF